MIKATTLHISILAATIAGCTESEHESERGDGGERGHANERGSRDGLQYVIELDDGSTLELWEQSGLRSLSGTNPTGVAPLHARYDLSGTPAEIFAQLRPGEPIPAALAELPWPARDDRAEQAMRMDPDRSLTASGFRAKYCNTNVITHQVVPYEPKRHVGDCQVNWQGGRWAAYNRKQEIYGAVNPTSGSVTFRRSAKYSNVASYTVTDWTVSQGVERWATTWASNTQPVDAKYEVLDAAGDLFHVATVYADTAICVTEHFCDINGFGWMYVSCDDGRESFTPTGQCSF